jgi:hypothetical protein
MTAYPAPAFVDPLAGVFAYAGWSVDPIRRGPFVRSSKVRDLKIDEIAAIAARVAQHPDIDAVQLMEATVMLPIAGMPRYDVVLLAHAATHTAAAEVIGDPQLEQTGPAAVFLATNAARFGITDTGDPRADILLNHFIGAVAPPAAVATWQKLSTWFAAKTGIDNSTLLQPSQPAPFVLVNYARLPSGVVGFLLNQILRPSFHRFVRGLLGRNHMTSLPLFVRPVSVGATDE